MSNPTQENKVNPAALELYGEVAYQRTRGASYAAISLLYDMPMHSVRNAIKRALVYGLFRRDQVILVPHKPHAKRSDEQYRLDAQARLRAMVVVDERGCWRWQGSHNEKGYGLSAWRGRTQNAHRCSWLAFKGVKLKREEYVCHTCDVRDCINPDHLWIGSQADNQNDSSRKGRHHEGAKTHCVRGHPFSGDNVIHGTQKGGRVKRRNCRECNRTRAEREKQKRREAA